jgi:hypothetical protein
MHDHLELTRLHQEHTILGWGHNNSSAVVASSISKMGSDPAQIPSHAQG